MLRSVIAVLAGLVVTMGLVMLATHALTIAFVAPGDVRPSGTYLTLNVVASAVAALAGGATAMWLAPHTPHGHTIALGLVLLLISLPTMFAAPTPDQPTWYGVVISVVGPVGVVLGGLLGERLRRRPRPAGGG